MVTDWGSERRGDGHTSRNDRSIIAWEAAVRRSGGRRAPEVIGGVREEVGAGLREEGSAAAVALREDDLVEEEDGWVGGGFGLALVDEFVET